MSLSHSPSWRGRDDSRFESCGVSTLWPEMVGNRHRHASIVRIATHQRRGQRKPQTYRRPADRPVDRLFIVAGQKTPTGLLPIGTTKCPLGQRGARAPPPTSIAHSQQHPHFATILVYSRLGCSAILHLVTSLNLTVAEGSPCCWTNNQANSWLTLGVAISVISKSNSKEVPQPLSDYYVAMFFPTCEGRMT